MFSKKHFVFGLIIGLVLLVSYLFALPDGKLHLVFCNVGQGDAAYIRAPNNQDMLIDGGPDDKVLTCLGKHMPFFDRTIDVVVLSHPQKDHLQGLLSVIQRYSVKYFVIGVEGNETEGYKKLVELIKQKNIPVKNLYTGDQFSLGAVKMSVLWPEKTWIAQQLSLSLSYLGNPQVLGVQTSRETNDFSYIVDLSYGSFDALFPGDGDSHIQPEVMKAANLPKVDVLKFPHHGSKTAMLAEFLDKIKPELAVISVGKNSYGHPTEEALELLSNKAIKLKRTDIDGDIEVVSDGKSYWVN
jgi:competence protein ComEC